MDKNVHSSIACNSPNWKQPKCPSKVADLQVEYYTVIKMSELQLQRAPRSEYHNHVKQKGVDTKYYIASMITSI